MIVPEPVAGSPNDLHDLLVAEGVSVLYQTPSAVGMLSPEGLENTALVVAGEAPPQRRGGSLGAGPGDDQRVRTDRGHRSTARMSAPLIAGTAGGAVPDRVTRPPVPPFVLDEWLRPVSAGVVGELYLAGRGVGVGYLNRSALTASPLRRLPVRRRRRPGQVMYRTGDLVRGRRRTAAIPGPCRRAGQDPRLPHRTRRDPSRPRRA